MDDDIKSKLVSTIEDTKLFSHDKMIATVEKHMDESGMKQMLSSDDKAMMMFETSLIDDGNEVDIEEEIDRYEGKNIKLPKEALGVDENDLKRPSGMIETKDDCDLDEGKKNIRKATLLPDGTED